MRTGMTGESMSEHRRTRMPTAHRAGGVVLCTTGGGAENSRKNTYSPLSSRAKRGDPVNKKALRAYRPQTYCTGLPQSYANVFNVSYDHHHPIAEQSSPLRRGGRRAGWCPAPMARTTSTLYTLHSTLYYSRASGNN